MIEQTKLEQEAAMHYRKMLVCLMEESIKKKGPVWIKQEKITRSMGDIFSVYGKSTEVTVEAHIMVEAKKDQ